jgi:hypothetical protein
VSCPVGSAARSRGRQRPREGRAHEKAAGHRGDRGGDRLDRRGAECGARDQLAVADTIRDGIGIRVVNGVQLPVCQPDRLPDIVPVRLASRVGERVGERLGERVGERVGDGKADEDADADADADEKNAQA